MKKDVILFYAAYFLMAFAKAFGLSTGDKSYYILFVLSAGLLGVRVLLMKPDGKQIVKMGLVLLPATVIFLLHRETTLLFTSLFVVGCAGIDFEDCVKWCAKIYPTAILLKLLLYFCGIVEGGSKPIYTHDSTGKAYLVGYTYGYGYIHPNMLFSVVFLAVLLWIYVKREKLDRKVICASTLIMLIVFLMTRSRTGLLIYLALLAAVLLRECFPKKERMLKGYCFLLMAGAFAVGILFPLIYTEENYLIFMANKFLSARPQWANEALAEYGVSLFGGAGIFLDNLYMDVLLNCGMVGFGMLLTGIVVLVRRFLRDGNTMGLVCTAVMVLYATMEQFPLNVGMNPFILYIGTNVLFCKEKHRERNKPN